MAMVFITGATGFLGRSLAAELVRRGHRVRALVRAGSENRVPVGCEVAVGDPLDATSYCHLVAPADAFVQLVGVSHPSPSKAGLFRSIDLAAANAGVNAASSVGILHFVYVSVAHPAPAMKAYIAVRMEAEQSIRAARLDATILRPWYVLGPGRRWPVALLPLYWVLGALPHTRKFGASARVSYVDPNGQNHRMVRGATRNRCSRFRSPADSRGRVIRGPRLSHARRYGAARLTSLPQ